MSNKHHDCGVCSYDMISAKRATQVLKLFVVNSYGHSYLFTFTLPSNL